MPPKPFRLLAEDKLAKVVTERQKKNQEEEDVTFPCLKPLVENILAAGRSALAVPAPSLCVGIEHVAFVSELVGGRWCKSCRYDWELCLECRGSEKLGR
jgi:hypothetical protein